MKTLAIRLEDDLHAQLLVVAQLGNTTITDEIRTALERHIASRRADPLLSARANEARQAIEEEAAARQAALSALFASPPSGPTPDNVEEKPDEPPTRPRTRR